MSKLKYEAENPRLVLIEDLPIGTVFEISGFVYMIIAIDSYGRPRQMHCLNLETGFVEDINTKLHVSPLIRGILRIE